MKDWGERGGAPNLVRPREGLAGAGPFPRAKEATDEAVHGQRNLGRWSFKKGGLTSLRVPPNGEIWGSAVWLSGLGADAFEFQMPTPGFEVIDFIHLWTTK